MTRTDVMASAALASLLALLASPARAGEGVRVDVPIAQAVLPNGDVRYSVPVSVGGGPAFPAGLDTGSFGLRVLARAAPPDRYEDLGVERAYPYGSGVRLNGPLARARVAIGGVEAEAPVVVQVVRTVDCVERLPRCPASRVDADTYGIEGDGYPGQGFAAILGISLRRAPATPGADNPLLAFADRWLVVLPRPGSAETGHLVLNPTADEAAGFALFRLASRSVGANGDGGWDDAALAGCLVDEDHGTRVCGPTLLDTGAPGVLLAASEDDFATGARATLTLTGGPAPIAIPFTVGADLSTAVRVRGSAPREDGRISAGTLPFFAYAVLYDAKAGTIGFKPR